MPVFWLLLLFFVSLCFLFVCFFWVVLSLITVPSEKEYTYKISCKPLATTVHMGVLNKGNEQPLSVQLHNTGGSLHAHSYFALMCLAKPLQIKLICLYEQDTSWLG